VILGFAAVAPIALVLLWPYSPPAAVAVLALSHALLLYPTFRPNVQWLGPVVTRFTASQPEVWLTIDDGPTEDTPEVLDLFERHRVRATFFVKGVLAAERPELIREMIRRGHSVANHSYTHPAGSFWISLPGRVGMEVDRCNRAVADAAGEAPRWFRAPVGIKNPAVHPVLQRRGMRLIGWSARGFDTFSSDADQILARLLPDLAPGAILMLHQGRAHSLRVLERVIVAVKERGYTFVIPDDERLRAA
jgi:peptidoglycan/xylan/chitin deacetylase (PgdA/CDA1 family)